MRALIWLASLALSVLAVGATDCGKTPFRPNLNGFIVGGVEARQHSIPWQIGFVKKSSGWQFCGGAIINSRTVVTAAHCYEGEDPRNFQIVVGQHSKKRPDKYTKKHNVAKIINHPRWNPQTLEHDIAVIKLSEDIQFNDAVQPICLPQSNWIYADGGKFLVTGWGLTSGHGHSSDVLKQAILPNHDERSCYWGQWSTYRSRITDGRLICAGWKDGSHGTCQGDSGGPLAKMVNGKWHLAGVVSFGNQGCSTDGMYTNVIGYLDFVKHYA